MGAAAERDFADSVIADVALVVSVDDVLGWAAEGGEGGDEAGPVGGGVDVKEGGGDVGGIVDGPAEGEGALFGGEDAGDDGGGDLAVLRGGDVEDDVFVAADVDGLGLMEDAVPGSVGGFEFRGFAGASEMLDVDVLNVGAEVGESPGDMVVVAYDDEGNTGEGDAGYVEVCSCWVWAPRDRLRTRCLGRCG